MYIHEKKTLSSSKASVFKMNFVVACKHIHINSMSSIHTNSIQSLCRYERQMCIYTLTLHNFIEWVTFEFLHKDLLF